MSDLDSLQMQKLLEQLVRNLDNSETSKNSRSRLDSVISSLDKIRSQLDKTHDTTKASVRGNDIDYSKLSSAIVSALRDAGPNSPSNRNRNSRSDRRITRDSSGRLTDRRRPAGNRRDGTLLNDLGRGAEDQIKNYGKVASSSDLLNNKLKGVNTQLGGLSSAISGVLKITGITKAFEAAKTAITDRADSYRTMMANGETFGGDMLQMSRVAASANMSLKNFTDAIANSSMGLKQMGPEVFASTVYQIKLANARFSDLGLTTQQTSSYMSDYMERLRISGHLQGQTSTSLSNGFRQLIQSSTSLAAAVGTSRDAILKAAEDIAKNQNNRALLHNVSGVGGQNITQYLSQMVNALGGGPEAYAMANAAMKASQGINTPDVAKYNQMMGPAFQQMVQNVNQLGQTNTSVDASTMARMGNSVLANAKNNYAGRDMRTMIAANDEYGNDNIALYNAINDAQIKPAAAAAAQSAQAGGQSKLTTGALGLDSSKEALQAAKEATATAALTTIQNTLGESLTAWNSAVQEGTHSYTQMIDKLSQNPLIAGIDKAGGSIISGLTNLLGPIALVGTVMGGIASIKIASSLRGLVSTVQHIRHGLHDNAIGKLMRERGVDYYSASKMHHRRSLAADRIRARSGRRGLLGGLRVGKLGRLGSLAGLGLDLFGLGGNDDDTSSDIPTPRGRVDRLRRAAKLRRLKSLRSAGKLGRLGSLLRTGAGGAEALGGVEALGAMGTLLAPAAVGLGGIGLGAMWNSQSTADYQHGKITSSQNNINHDSNYGMMGGAVTGAAAGAIIGSVVPIIGTAVGGVIGGLVGGLGGYGIGHGIGSWANSGTDTSSPSVNNTSTPGAPEATNNNSPSDANILLQKILDQLTIQSTTLSDQDSTMQRLLQNIDRNTGDTVRQMKRAGNTI